MRYFEWRNEKKKEIEKDREARKRDLWSEYNDADLSIIGVLEAAITLLALAKTKLSKFTPVEGKICYKFIWDCLSDLCNFVNEFINDSAARCRRSLANFG